MILCQDDGYSTLSVIHGDCGLLTINRRGDPANLIDVGMVESLTRRLRQILAHCEEGRHRIHHLVVVVEDGDMRGVDINYLLTLPDHCDRVRFVDRVRELFQNFAELPIPTIFAANSKQKFAGGGFEFGMIWDYRVGRPDCSFQLTEVKRLGIIPGFGGTQRLARLIGSNEAARAIICGTVFGSRSALDSGILDFVFEGEKGKLHDLAWEYIEGLPKRQYPSPCLAWTNTATALQELFELRPTYPEVAVTAAVTAIIAGSKQPSMRESLQVEGELFDRVLCSAPAKEGLAALQRGVNVSWIVAEQQRSLEARLQKRPAVTDLPEG